MASHRDGIERRFSYAYYTLLIIGLIPFLLAFIFAGIARLWAQKVGKHSIGSIHLPFMCEDQEKARRLLMSGLKESTPFFGIVYNNVCSMTFSNFSCMTLRSGVQVLTVAPQIVCYDSYEHKVLLGISIVALVVYVCGIPAIILGLTIYAKSKDMLRDREWLTVAGIFYREYGTCLATRMAFIEGAGGAPLARARTHMLRHSIAISMHAEPSYYWWDVVFCMRKFALCLCAVAFRGMQSTQAVCRFSQLSMNAE